MKIVFGNMEIVGLDRIIEFSPLSVETKMITEQYKVC